MTHRPTDDLRRPLTSLRSSATPDSYRQTVRWLRSQPRPRVPAVVPALVVALALGLGSCSYTVESDVPFGVLVTANAPPAASALPWLAAAQREGDAVYRIRRDGGRQLAVFVPAESQARAEDRRASLQAAGYTDVDVQRLTAPHRRPLAMAALERLRLISVDGRGLDDDALAASLRRQMESAGLRSATIDIARTESGERRVILVGTEETRSPDVPAEAVFRIDTVPDAAH